MPRWAGILGAAVLLTWQAWLTLALFGEDPWSKLWSDEPIVSGLHARHLYHGTLGAHAVSVHGRTTFFDHANLAGYPVTPMFDGSRLAALFLLLGGGTYQPAAYKLGVAVLCVLVPCFFLFTCKSLGLGNATTLAATFLGQLIWWGPHGRSALVAGECELYLASLAALSHLGLLIAFHRTTSVWSWLGLLITGTLGWFLQPLLFPIAMPILLTYYLSVGVKHDFLTWHVAFWSVETLGLLINLPWLLDWLDSWWLRTALPSASGLLEHRTLQTFWNAPLWGGATNRALAVVLIVGAAVGAVIFNQTKARPAARLLGFSTGGALVLALLGISWEPLGGFGTAALFAPALWFACIPAAHGAVWLMEWIWTRGKSGRAGLAGLIAALVCTLSYWHDGASNLLARCRPGAPLEVGLGPERLAIVQALLDHTDASARILWEDRPGDQAAFGGSHWPALLPILTERSYFGGIDPDGLMEHSSSSPSHQTGERRLIELWTDAQLMDYCRLYNVRWIAAWSPKMIQRLQHWKDARKLSALVDGETGYLFEVKRTPAFALKGQAEFVQADGRYVRLAHVMPENGEVVLSLHFHAGMRAFPARVQVDRAPSDADSIGFVRLRLNEPAVGVTLAWER